MATSAWSNAIAKKDNLNSIQIPLKLAESKSHKHCWKVIQFQNKLPNKIVSDKEGLHVGVESSVSLLAYCLKKPVDVNGVLLQGSVTGVPRIKKNTQQGDKKADVPALRRCGL